ncbi:MAG TPA: protein kinase, partial [Pirellulales bacterium]|nr:protein kinase [Pirellulales bacterium]
MRAANEAGSDLDLSNELADLRRRFDEFQQIHGANQIPRKEMSVEQRRCAQCGTKLTADGPNGLCPACGSKLHPENPAAPNLAVTSPWGSRFSAPKTEELACYFPQLEITELLGQGGMGAVYKARQLTLDRLVAVKILPAEVAGDPAFAERFTREARALARLNHPNIVGIHDFGQAGGLYYFVMEYVDGDSLRQLVAKKESSVRQTLALVPQMCDALQFAHDEGIVHRDIKPENILIDKRGRVKVADFGLAKLLGRSADEATLTRVEQVMGTPLYMAPEQMQGSHAVDHRADIYSLGVVFYEMLTGELPLGRFAPPSQKVEVDMRLDEVVLRALEREPDRRYQHASDLKTDVEAIASQRQAVALQAAREPLPMGRDEPAGQRGDRVLLDAADRSTRPLQRLGLLLVGVVLLLWGAGLLLRIPYFVS